MAVKRISNLDSAVNIQDTDLLAIVNEGTTRKTTVNDLNTAISNSSNPKLACRTATTANVNLSTGGLLTIDGTLLQENDRVLVWKQTNAVQNGIYLVASGAWVRAQDFNETAEIRSGSLIPIVQGTVYKQSIFQFTNTGSIAIGTSTVAFARLTGWIFNETTNVVSLTGRAVHISSLQINSGLAQYDAERHDQYDARTLVDKEYVDSQVGNLDAQWGTTGDDLYYNTGNVGIGVVTPVADLHLQGSLKFIDGNEQNGKVLTSDDAGIATWQPIPVNALWSAGTNDNIYYTPGRVGIGIVNPDSTLHVQGSIKIADGTQQTGSVLTSDASGAASWQPVPEPTASNGLYTTENDIRLGGTLTENTVISDVNNHGFAVNAENGNRLELTNSGDLLLNTNTQMTLTAQLDGGTAGIAMSVQDSQEADNDTYLNIFSPNNNATESEPSGVVIGRKSSYDQNNIVQEGLRLKRHMWTENMESAAGIGISLLFDIKSGGTGYVPVCGIAYSLTNVAEDNEDAKYAFSLAKAGEKTTIAELDGTGLRYLDDYSTDFSPRSLVDKAYVDNALGSAGGTRTVVTQDISAAVTIDLSAGDLFILTITANVYSFSFLNETVGKDYIFVFIKTDTNKNLTWTAGKYRFPFGNSPVLTDPTTNGSDPVKSVDIVTGIAAVEGRLDIVFTPNLTEN